MATSVQADSDGPGRAAAGHPLLESAALATHLRALAGGSEPPRLVCALSAGLDSSSLIHVLAQGPARAAGIRVRAIHVNHGLHPDAAKWAARASELCAGLGIDCQHLAVTLAPGGNVEARARAARYAAIAAALEPGECLLTAHHRDDQAETLLLQLLRGAGPAGLAAMPERAEFGRGWHLRPWLDVPRAAIAAHAARAGLVFVDDPSNADPSLDRNYLRHCVMPVLRARWPAVDAALCRSARHAASADALLTELARLDCGPLSGDVIAVAALAGPPRRANALRAWLRANGVVLPNSRRLDDYVAQLDSAAEDRLPEIVFGGVTLRAWRGRVYLCRDTTRPPPGWRGTLRVDAPLALPAGLGELRLVPDGAGGLSAAAAAAGLTVRFRDGGEKIVAAPGTVRRTLKNLTREWGVLPWMRTALPLVYDGDILIAVADMCAHAPALAAQGEAAVRIEWRSRPRLLGGDD